MKKILILIAVCICITACQTDNTGTLKTIPVNVDQDSPVNLSEIADDIKKISLEVTDESLISIIRKVIYADEMLIVFDYRAGVLVFSEEGKFLRKIGNKGQGPSEYNTIFDIAYDSDKKIIYICTGRRIMSYDIQGVFINEGVFITEVLSRGAAIYFFLQDGYFNLFAERKEQIGDKLIVYMYIYRMDEDYRIKDSILVNSIVPTQGIAGGSNVDIVSHADSKTYVYSKISAGEPFNRDTLYQLVDNTLIPSLRLRFSDEGYLLANGIKPTTLRSIWRSDRFLFAHYTKFIDIMYVPNENVIFMHDLKTENSFNIIGGINDDVYNAGKVLLRPLHNESDLFYCIVTPKLLDASKEEPNPDVYIGRYRK